MSGSVPPNAFVAFTNACFNASFAWLAETVGPVVNPPLAPLYAAVHALHPENPAYPHPIKGGIEGSWYLSPAQHVWEMAVIGLVSLSLFVLGWRHLTSAHGLYTRFKLSRAWQEDSEYSYTREVAGGGLRRRVVSTIWLVLLWSHIVAVNVCLLAAVYFKWTHPDGGQFIFLLQPCHMSNLTLVLVTWMPKRHKAKHLVFNVYLYLMWSTLLALIAPDTRNYTRELEIEHFFLQHWLLITTPFVFLYSGYVTLFPFSADLAVTAWGSMCLYHIWVLSPLAVIFSRNLNYTLSPPPNTFLLHFHHTYRWVFVVFCGALCFISRVLMVSTVTTLFHLNTADMSLPGRDKASKKKKKKTNKDKHE